MARALSFGLIGDAGVGKTSFWSRWKSGAAPEASSVAGDIDPHQLKVEDFGRHTKTVTIDGIDTSVTLWDLQGDKEVSRVRALVYPELSAVFVMFAIDNEHSLNSTGTFWATDTHPAVLDTSKPRLLVGTKADLREQGAATVSPGQARKHMGAIRAKEYYECSAQTGAGVNEVIAAGVRACTNGSATGCCVLA